jgi:hypothetical protein
VVWLVFLTGWQAMLVLLSRYPVLG